MTAECPGSLIHLFATPCVLQTFTQLNSWVQRRSCQRRTSNTVLVSWIIKGHDISIGGWQYVDEPLPGKKLND